MTDPGTKGFDDAAGIDRQLQTYYARPARRPPMVTDERERLAAWLNDYADGIYATPANGNLRAIAALLRSSHAMDERCHVVGENCEGTFGTRCKCYACGEPVCIRCSRKIRWHNTGRHRICDLCIEEEKRYIAHPMMADDARAMERAERKARRIFKANGYRVTAPDCCATCRHGIDPDPEESRTCRLADLEGWMFNDVSELGLCNKYWRRAAEKGG